MYKGVFFTNTSDIEQIIENSFLILERYGVLVEHEDAVQLLFDLADDKIELKDNRVRLSSSFVKDFFYSFAEKNKLPAAPSLSVTAEIYEGKYLDPIDGEYKPWNEERLINYIKLGKNLEGIDAVSMLGCPLPELDSRKRPLYEKLYAFKYGTTGSYAIWETGLCPQLYDIWQIYADEKKQPVKDVFQGTVFMISPLKMGHVELEQMLWFRGKGLKVGAGTLASIGMSAPITLAGALSLHIAEQIFLAIQNFAFFNERYFSLTSSLSVIDMHTAAFQYGRPEQVLLNNAMCDIASYYNLPFSAHCGLSDAKKPSYEAGVQKTGTALAAIMKGGKGHIAAGLLSVDEVYSPVQMILDNEAAGYLRRICDGFPVTEETLALEPLGDCISDNSYFIDKFHTSENYKTCTWKPSLFSSEMLAAWDRRSDMDKAREIVIDILKKPLSGPNISADCEQKITEIINFVK